MAATGFWNANTTEPIRSFRWYITFGSGGAGLDNYQYALKKVERPKMKVNSIQHKYLNHFYNFPGRVEWEDINVTFAAVEGGSKNMMDILGKMGYQFPTALSDRKTISKANATTNLGATVEIVSVKADGNPAETFTLLNPYFNSIQFGSLDYSSEDIVEISCAIKYDSASIK